MEETTSENYSSECEVRLDYKQEIENQRNVLKQIEEQNKQRLIEQIDNWEEISIKKIQETAEKNRKMILKETKEHFRKIEFELNRLIDQDQQKLDLKDKLDELQQELNNISLKEENLPSSFINKINVQIEYKMINIPIDMKWKQTAITIIGKEPDDLDTPYSICMDDEETIYIADYDNHRVVELKKDSTTYRIVAGRNGNGNGDHQLSHPIKVILDEINDSLIISDLGNQRIVRWPLHGDQTGETIINNVCAADLVLYKNEYLYVCDEEKHEVRRWKIGDKQGTLVAGGNGKGNKLNQFNQPIGISIDVDETLYISDSLNHRIMKWRKGAKEGIVVIGEHGSGKEVNQLTSPYGILRDRSGTFYIADCSNNRIVRWLKDAKEGSIVVGENYYGIGPNKLYHPSSFLFDNEYNLIVVDCYNHRIQKFLLDN